MIFFLSEYLPAAFTYTSTRMTLAALTALLVSILSGPYVIRRLYQLKIGQPILIHLKDLHQDKQDTPTMGGILILTSMLCALLLWMDLRDPYTLILLATTLVLGGLGSYDDYLKLKRRANRGLSGRKKLLIQVLFSFFLCAYLLYSVTMSEFIPLLYLPFYKYPILTLPAVFFFLWTAFVVTGSSNAVNLSDGLDGLASGLVIMVAAVLAAVGFLSSHLDLSHYLNILYIQGSGEIAVYLAAMIGACVGFLWYNSYPAQVFMGDTGSIALGGILGVSAVLLRRECLLALVGGVFVVEALSVILQVGSYRYRNKKRLFLCAPLHHHFEYKGWPETKIVTRFWIFGLLLAIVGLASLKFQ